MLMRDVCVYEIIRMYEINVCLIAHDKLTIIYIKIYIYFKCVKELLSVYKMHFSGFTLVACCFELTCKPKFA